MQIMKALPYILVGIACFALGWFARPGGKAVHETDTIQSPPLVVTRTKVDTLMLLSPQPYIAWLTGDTVEVDGCRLHSTVYRCIPAPVMLTGISTAMSYGKKSKKGGASD